MQPEKQPFPFLYQAETGGRVKDRAWGEQKIGGKVGKGWGKKKSAFPSHA